jgi:cyclic pyranopterin phosphate synthase
MGSMVLDRFRRPLKNLRLSVTDRCNLRCQYCMPEEDYVWLPRSELLSFEELVRLVNIFSQLGVEKLRLTGGEPLLRTNLHELVSQIRSQTSIQEVALTTNGIFLPTQAEVLRAAGVTRVTISLDTVNAQRFQTLTRRDQFASVLAGIEAGQKYFPKGLKLNTVVMRGVNDDELVPLIELAKRYGAEPRFIEYMDVGGATRWASSLVYPRREMLQKLSAYYGEVIEIREDSSAPAERFFLPDGTRIGIIASTTAPFCLRCDRSRLTADGSLFRCLYARDGIDLRRPLREGASDDELAALVRSAWESRVDRGAEERLALLQRKPLAAAEELRMQPHLEMHTRGG